MTEGATPRSITAKPLTAEAFAPFGDVIMPREKPDRIINQGNCGRHHDLAKLTFGDGRAGLSLFDAKARHMPYHLDMMERHPLGSQAFVPMCDVPMIVTVAPDDHGRPGPISAFITAPHQAINLHVNVWHGVLAPYERAGRYAVVDRIDGSGENLEEFWFDETIMIIE